MVKLKSNEDFLKEIYELVGEEYAVLTKYEGAIKDCYFRHNNKSCNNNEFSMRPNAFLFGSRCPKCGLESKRKKKALGDKEFRKRLKEDLGNNFKTDDNYINNHTTMNFISLTCNHSFSTTPKSLLRYKKCKICSNKNKGAWKKKSHEQFVKEVFDLVNNEYSVLSQYVTTDAKVLFKHNNDSCEYHEFHGTPDNFLHGSRCPKCAGNTLKMHDDFLKEVKNLVGNEYSILSQYNGNKKGVIIRHNNYSCNNYTYIVTPNRFLRGNRCPVCNSSKGEDKIKNFLISKKLNFKVQKSFKNCKNILQLPFDFAIYDESNNLLFLLEYDGEQHFYPIEYFGGEKGFEETKRRDEIKNRYCKDNNIFLLRISYWDYNNIEEILNNYLNTIQI